MQYIALDFEATCDEPDNPDPQEVIERAKGILMKLKGLTEDEAYVLLRSTAMREKKKIGEIAQSILTASELLK